MKSLIIAILIISNFITYKISYWALMVELPEQIEQAWKGGAVIERLHFFNDKELMKMKHDALSPLTGYTGEELYALAKEGRVYLYSCSKYNNGEIIDLLPIYLETKLTEETAKALDCTRDDYVRRNNNVSK